MFGADDIRRIRMAAFLSQEDFGRELDVSFTTVNRWENGRSKPNLKKIRLIRAFCNKHNIPFELHTEDKNG